MKRQEAQGVLEKIMQQVFGRKNPYDLDSFMQKYAFDVRLPSEVYDSTTGEATWASSTNSAQFITLNNARARGEVDEYMLPKRPLGTVQDVLEAWVLTNQTSTERYIDSINVHESDCINSCENVFRSQDCTRSKHVLYSDGAVDCEFVAAVQRSIRTSFSLRVEDSQNIANSFSVVWSNKVNQSLFINDCFDVSDCLFTSHLAGKQYCVANMQYTKEEYTKIREMVVDWILKA
ncbi:MAG: hypothetical protein JNK33_02690 [Candidatus Doudnabacteria bacterium]|nr:hypothetical protein [Candidatus Doudnabacteria bacterium]